MNSRATSHRPVPRRSIRRRLASGGHKTFPSATDLIHYYIDKGEISGIDELYGDKLELVVDVAFDWLRYGQEACHFALFMASKPEEYRWYSIVVDGVLRESAAETLRLVTDDPDFADAEALQFIFPDVATSEHVVALVNNLCSDDSWYWVKEPGSRGHLSIGLRWILPSDESVNWTLGFALYGDMPFTRRAPFTMLVLRPKDSHGPEFSGSPRGKEFGRSTVHLADMDISQWPDTRKRQFSEATTKNKREYLAGEFQRGARARVTFTVPSACGGLLVSPRQPTKKKGGRRRR